MLYAETVIYLLAGDLVRPCETVEDAATVVAEWYLTGRRDFEYVMPVTVDTHERIIELATNHITARDDEYTTGVEETT